MDIAGYLMLGAGVFIVYSAYKGHSPWTVFLSFINTTSTPAKP